MKTRVENKWNFLLNIIIDIFKRKEYAKSVDGLAKAFKGRLDHLKKYNYYIYLENGYLIAGELKVDGRFCCYDPEEIERFSKL